MRCRILAALCLVACKAAPPPIAPDAEPVLVEAERMLTASDYEGARNRLLARDENEFPKSLQPRYELVIARSWLAESQPWAAFQALRNFADRHPHSELREQVVTVLYQAGNDLIASDGGFWPFWSDRRGGRTCLEHLITRYPESQHYADALRMLGEMAFADGDYDIAQERFRDLLVKRPDSEWVPKARFLFAMSLVASLRGPDYDLDQMQHATKELRDFLANPPEQPDYVAEAKSTLLRLLEWQAERHVKVADFYRTIGNRAGERNGLVRAADAEFADTAAGTDARLRLQALDTAASTGAVK